MADAEDNSNREQCASSAPRMVPRQSPLKLDYKSTQCASFVSQRSSSLETNGSSSPTNSSDGNFLEPQVQDIPDNNVSSERSDESAVEHNSTTVNRDSTSTDPQHWLCNDESLPSSLLHPEHQSTPAKDNKYMSTVDGEGDSALAHLSGENTTEPEEEKEKEVFLPGDLHTPIMGFETMEERSRFTVFKIRVQKTASGLESSGWFVFRRYSDFLHLNERLKSLFPGFRLSLPPKRWFRDNFDKNFLEDRMIGLQAFLDNITGHMDICNSDPVRSFLCTDDPPGPHDSLEESRALCETLEESMYTLRQELQEKETEVSLLKEELDLYKSQVQLLSTQLRVLNSSLPRADSAVTSSSTRHSLAECDRHSMPSPPSPQPKSQPEVQDSVSE